MRAIPFQSFYRHALLAGFLVLLFAPLVTMLVTEREVYSITERRALSTWPRLPETAEQLPQYLRNIDDYLNDHFGLRDYLVFRYQREIRKRFGIVGADTTVYPGLDNWYYFDQGKMLLDFAGKSSLSKDQVASWHQKFDEKKTWLKDRDIAYLYIIAPNKSSVYPEYVMKSWRNVQGQTRLQQLAITSPNPSANALLDLARYLQHRKNKGLLYFKSDTHWTDYGAYFGYLAITEKLAILLPHVNFRTEFTFYPPTTRHCQSPSTECGDLTDMLLDFPPFEESYLMLRHDQLHAHRLPLPYPLSNLPEAALLPSFVSRCPGKLARAIVFRDSFFNSLAPYLSENFQEVIYLSKSYDQQNIEEILRYFKPDIVIEEIVERRFAIEL